MNRKRFICTCLHAFINIRGITKVRKIIRKLFSRSNSRINEKFIPDIIMRFFVRISAIFFNYDFN